MAACVESTIVESAATAIATTAVVATAITAAYVPVDGSSIAQACSRSRDGHNSCDHNSRAGKSHDRSNRDTRGQRR